MVSLIPMLLFVILVGLCSFAFVKQTLARKCEKKSAFKRPPGPCGLPILGNIHMLGDLPHHDLHNLAKKYGPIMYLKLGLVPTIVVSSPEAAKLFLQTHDTLFASRPKSQAAEYISYGQKGIVISEYGPYWRKMRKLCTLELLTSSKIELFKPMRGEELSNLVKVLKVASDAGEVVDLNSLVESLIENISYRMIFGCKDDCFNFKSCIREAVELSGAFNLSDFVSFLGPLDLQGLTRRMKSVSQDLDEKLNKIIDEHMKGATEQHDQKDKNFVGIMLSLMKLNNVHDGQLDLDSVKAVLIDMLGATMDTATNVILWAFSELLKHPHIMKQVQEEIQNVVGTDGMVEETDLVKLEYLNMVIKESMRLHPVVPLFHHTCNEDVVINQFYIPNNSRVIINAWAIGRDSDAWSDNAEAFDPSRFANNAVDFHGRDCQLIPFGSGRRACPGLQMGLRTVQLVLAQLLHCFNWELPHGMLPCALDMSEKFGLVVSRAKPLLCLPTFRLNNNL